MAESRRKILPRPEFRRKSPEEHQTAAPVETTATRVQGPSLKLDPTGAASPTIASARNGIRHRIRDGVPSLDTNPVPFNVVRLESLSDQIPASGSETVYQVRFEDVPTQRYMNAQVVPGTLVAFVDGAWTPTTPSVDVDQNGNFTLASAPTTALLVTYAWQYLSDGEINQFIDEARQWLREFQTVDTIPDGLTHALISYGASRALYSLQRTAILAPVRAGDSDVDWSKLSASYQKAADQQYAIACKEREQYYSQFPESLDPTAVDVSAIVLQPYGPIR